MSEFVPTIEITNLPSFRFDDAKLAGIGDIDSAFSFDTKERRERALRAKQSGLPIEWQDAAPAAPVQTASRKFSLALKRGVDIAGAMLGLMALGPLLLIVAAGVKLTDRGPALFRQQRVGMNGKPFDIYKFRSMYFDRCDVSGIAQTVASDSRVTPIGRIIRKTSIDELPQLLNVLRGEMSLVGPRPHVAGMLAAGVAYEDLSPHYAYRYHMRPGITGWAQCNRFRGATVSEDQAFGRLGHDIAYVQNYSLTLDAKVIWRTLRQEFLSGAAH
ncbi:Sugar transferase involved in LPS biosynthesis (colanic, teichoic acid) [Devosia sp. YR412]|uniref:sugar transferase n=1 Tax=Devosia sp. YR412 TaxID=1881030 RepID=UPI0008BBB5EF|nr:sugar transferase [Devosia sp. YR412]SEP95545.1 Sugar transferase involved in LPS biosynthesis (colanic, teichoic acid) [Devosia sp. YR412]